MAVWAPLPTEVLRHGLCHSVVFIKQRDQPKYVQWCNVQVIELNFEVVTKILILCRSSGQVLVIRHHSYELLIAWTKTGPDVRFAVKFVPPG